MAIIDDVKQHVGGIGPVGEVPDLVDNEDRGVGVRGQGVGEPTATEGRREIIDQFGGGDKPGVEAVLDRAIRNGDCQVRFAATGFAAQDE